MSSPLAMAPPPAPMASHRRCRAHSSQSGQPCRATAVRGATVCIAHGAGAPAVKARAAERVQRQKAGARLMAMGIEVGPADPLEVLQKRLAEADAITDAAAELVSELEDIAPANHHGDRKPDALVKIQGERFDRSARMAKLALDNGLAEKALERLSRIGETQAAEMVEAFTAAMNDPVLNLTDEQKAIAKKAAARHLRAQAATE